ncbi:Uncharacterised protein [Mycobacteroides abscessus subsp. massiliense]|nr:Uncharacterised protein [Mycobacteroides abscessus subsp. massiliense]
MVSGNRSANRAAVSGERASPPANTRVSVLPRRVLVSAGSVSSASKKLLTIAGIKCAVVTFSEANASIIRTGSFSHPAGSRYTEAPDIVHQNNCQMEASNEKDDFSTMMSSSVNGNCPCIPDKKAAA